MKAKRIEVTSEEVEHALRLLGALLGRVRVPLSKRQRLAIRADRYLAKAAKTKPKWKRRKKKPPQR